jgi:hypothetical protein
MEPTNKLYGIEADFPGFDLTHIGLGDAHK